MQHILIANRAAIAVHAAQVCRRLGYETTALAAAADTQSTHVAFADHRILVPGRGQDDTYDSAERVLAAVDASGVDTVYPGYGALAENARFVEGLEERGVTFVGPPASALRLAGSKAAAVEAARRAGVAVLSHTTARGGSALLAALTEIGTPAIVKPDLGEGGEGVRVVRSAREAAEVAAAAGPEQLWYVERFVPGNRVVGVTLAVDGSGCVLPLGERESLLTADGLKLLEASPVVGIDAPTLTSMRADAARLAVAFGLRNVMTVEFIVGPDRYCFLEVNGRLPLAYRMSELQTSHDLVELQLRIARGEDIDPARWTVDRSLHALEVRLFVEPGELTAFPDLRPLDELSLADVDGLAWDCSVDPARPMSYERLLAKGLARADTRAAAAGLIGKGLESSSVTGLGCYTGPIGRAVDELTRGTPGEARRGQAVRGTPEVPARKGLVISFLGIDGIGKSTLCRAFEKHARDAGAEVVTVTWRSALEQVDTPWPAVPLQQLWLESFRTLYGAGTRDHKALDIPRDYERWEAEGWEKQLASAPVLHNRAAGALAAAFVEIAGNVILASEVTHKAVARGALVVQESYPLKHVLKELAVAQRLAERGQTADDPAAPAIGALVTAVRGLLDVIFGSSLLRPDIGVLVDGPSDYAYRWRTAQNGALGALEDFGAAGERSRQSFSDLQDETARLFREYADSRGWIVHHVDDSGVAANTARGVEALCAHPDLVEWFRSP